MNQKTHTLTLSLVRVPGQGEGIRNRGTETYKLQGQACQPVRSRYMTFFGPALYWAAAHEEV
jgi:hypothetical protein